MVDYENNSEIKILREYLRIPSVHPNVDYEPCVEFLKRQAAALELPIQIFRPTKRQKPIVVISWIGQRPELPSIMFNSHMDVVPVFPDKWDYPPFEAVMTSDGKIFARGIQDTKALGMQYLAAIRALKRAGFTGQRTTRVTFVPDEEIGGRDGMNIFVRTDFFRNLNICFAMDEGIASPILKYPVFYAERAKCQVLFQINGVSGDSSLLPKDSAGEKFAYLLKKFTDFRAHELKHLCETPNLLLGDVSTVNLTIANSGEDCNNLPPRIEATFDVRLAPTVDIQKFISQLNQWCEEAGGGIDLDILDSDFSTQITVLDESNPFWMALKQTCEKENITLLPVVCPGSTDMRFLREMKIPALGFSPMPKTQILLHDHNEYLHADTYLNGIELFKKIIPALLDAGIQQEVKLLT